MSYRTRVYRQRNVQPQVGEQNDPFFSSRKIATAQPSFFQIQRQVTDPIPETKNQFYGHGAFMGAAPQLMADPRWNRILQSLMPDVYADATEALKKGPNSPDLILMMENNPVMAAYGMYQTKQMDVKKEGGRDDRISKMEAIEWDAFLPTSTVESFKKSKSDKEKKRLAHEIVENMIIAHGTAWQTAKENAPRGGWRQYENVKGTKKSGQGGVRPGAWMDLFGKALQLATDPNWEQKAKEFEDPTLHPRVESPDDQAAHQTFKNQLPFNQVINEYKKIFGKETFSVLLDIKSRDATPQVLAAVVQDLNLRGVLVYGVGSFQHHEIAGLSLVDQNVGGKIYKGPKEVKFFHFSGDLQEACLANKIEEGDTVMFNGGSLIDYDRVARGKNKKASYKIMDDVVKQLAYYKEYYGFSLGIYVQENDIDDRAAELLTNLSNSRPDIFDLGFAWGGLSGQTAADIEPSLWNATVGTYNQSKVGTYWDVDKPIPTIFSGAPTGFSSSIRMQYRYMESRRFSVGKGVVSVTSNASWNDPGCLPDTYHITLARDISFWPDSEKGTMGFPVGELHGATWSGLESGEYYLKIWMSDHDPRCILTGNIKVST